MVKTTIQTGFSKFLEKLFWITIPFIFTGVISLVVMVNNISTDLKVMKVHDEERGRVQEKTWQIATQNNSILQGKADDRTNTQQHIEMLQKIDGISIYMSRLLRMHNMGYLPLAPRDTLREASAFSYSPFNTKQK